MKQKKEYFKNKNKSMLIGISLGTLIAIMGTFSNMTDEST